MYWNYKSNFSILSQSTKHNIKRHSNSSFIHHSVSGTKCTDISKNTNQICFVFLPPLVKYKMYTCAWLVHAYFYTRLKYTHGKRSKEQNTKSRHVAGTFANPTAPQIMEDRIIQIKVWRESTALNIQIACSPSCDALAIILEYRPLCSTWHFWQYQSLYRLYIFIRVELIIKNKQALVYFSKRTLWSFIHAKWCFPWFHCDFSIYRYIHGAFINKWDMRNIQNIPPWFFPIS